MKFNRIAIIGSVAALLAMSGCSWLTPSGPDYRTQGKNTKIRSLDVPPDLTRPIGDDRFLVPDAKATTYSQYNRERSGQAAQVVSSGSAVLPKFENARIVRVGEQQWLVVKAAPERVWPVVKEFWTESGFVVNRETPEAGIMETDWKEQRPPADSWLRNKLSSVLGSVYSTGIREKFRARLEVSGNGTDVFVSQRGMTEKLVGVQADSTLWTMNPPSPEIEAEYLQRLALRFLPQQQAKAKEAAALETVVLPVRSKLIDVDGRSFVQLPDTFDRSWRQVGLALDRSGFTVEDRDRSNGIYYIRYVDTNQVDKQPGLFDRVFGTGASKNLSGKKFRVTVTADSAGSRVGVLDDNGALPATDADKRLATQIVTVLNDQLR